MWLATYAAMLARKSHWSLDYILWELPYAIGLQIEQVYLRCEGVWIVPVKPPAPPVTDDGLDALLTDIP